VVTSTYYATFTEIGLSTNVPIMYGYQTFPASQQWANFLLGGGCAAPVTSFNLSCTSSSMNLYGFGASNYGQAGDGNGATTARAVPSAVLTSGALNGVNLIDVALGTAHVAALSSDGRVRLFIIV
jgi:alpha-tubulin suppressor-like RCC1 family protein